MDAGRDPESMVKQRNGGHSIGRVISEINQLIYQLTSSQAFN